MIVGKLTLKNGAVYQGQWKNAKKHGKGNKGNNSIGKYKDEKGVTYDGNWAHNKKEGEGKKI